jgi:hypothetical protein
LKRFLAEFCAEAAEPDVLMGLGKISLSKQPDEDAGLHLWLYRYVWAERDVQDIVFFVPEGAALIGMTGVLCFRGDAGN